MALPRLIETSLMIRAEVLVNDGVLRVVGRGDTLGRDASRPPDDASTIGFCGFFDIVLRSLSMPCADAYFATLSCIPKRP